MNMNESMSSCHLEKFSRDNVDFLSIMLMHENTRNFAHYSIIQWQRQIDALNESQKKSPFFFIDLYNERRSNFPNAMILAFLIFYQNPSYVKHCMSLQGEAQSACFSKFFYWIDRIFLEQNRQSTYKLDVRLCDRNDVKRESLENVDQTMLALFSNVESNVVDSDADADEIAMGKKHLTSFKNYFRKEKILRLSESVKDALNKMPSTSITKIPSSQSISSFATQLIASAFEPLMKKIIPNVKDKNSIFVKTMLIINNVKSGNPMPFGDVVNVIIAIFMKMNSVQIGDFLISMLKDVPSFPTMKQAFALFSTWIAGSFPALSPILPILEKINDFVSPAWDKYFSHYTMMIVKKINQTITSVLLPSENGKKEEGQIRSLFSRFVGIFVYAGRLLYRYYIFTVTWNISLIRWIAPYVPTITKLLL